MVVRQEKRLQDGNDITLNLRLKLGESQLDPLTFERTIRESYVEGDVEVHVHLRSVPLKVKAAIFAPRFSGCS